MELNFLVVLDREVEAPLVVCHLHEEPGDQRLPDVDVVLLGLKGGGLEREVEPLHDLGELGADIVGRLHRPVVDVVIVTPGRVIFRLLVCVVHVQKSQVVPVDVCKAALGLVSSLLLVVGADETTSSSSTKYSKNPVRRRKRKKEKETGKHTSWERRAWR